jgi:uncharacterized protein YndB with AHSA1/START domain
MSNRDDYTPGPAARIEVQKNGDKWTLVLVRDLRHPPALVWSALTDPAQLRQWAPYDADADLATSRTVKLTWGGTPVAVDTPVTRADPPKLLELGDLRWELEPLAGGTRLKLWHSIDRKYVAWGAAGWHICFDVLDRLLEGAPLGRIVGADAMKFEGWQRLTAEYGKQLGAEG